MSESARSYLPAAGRDLFLPLYDPFGKLMGMDKARKALVEQADLRPGQRVLDIGCGTGSLAVMIRQLYPDVEIIGLDPDPKALARSRRKAERAGVPIQFDRGFSDELPYADASFDGVFSSMMFHHLGREEKQKTLREVWRVLKPGGGLNLVDFAGPEHGAHGFLAHLLHSNKRLRDNNASRVLTMMTDAGYSNPQKIGEQIRLIGTIAFYRAVVPSPEK